MPLNPYAAIDNPKLLILHINLFPFPFPVSALTNYCLPKLIRRKETMSSLSELRGIILSDFSFLSWSVGSYTDTTREIQALFFFLNTEKETDSYRVSLKISKVEELRLYLHEQLSWPNSSLPLKMRGRMALPSLHPSAPPCPFLGGCSDTQETLPLEGLHSGLVPLCTGSFLSSWGWRCHSDGSSGSSAVGKQLWSEKKGIIPILAAAMCLIKSRRLTWLCAVLQDETDD